MVLSIRERIRGFLFSPSVTFDNSKEDTIGDAFKYFIVILAIYAVLSAIIGAVAFSLILEMFSAFLPPGTLPLEVQQLGTAMGPLFAVVIFLGVLVGGIIEAFIIGLWSHLWVYLVGGRNGIGQTIKAVMYGMTPICLIGWIPIVSIIADIWALIVGIVGIRQLHKLSTGKAVLAVLIALFLPAIIIVAIIVTLIATMS